VIHGVLFKIPTTIIKLEEILERSNSHSNPSRKKKKLGMEGNGKEEKKSYGNIKKFTWQNRQQSYHGQRV
jgi:hypothetical protein